MDGSGLRDGDLEGPLSLGPKPDGLETVTDRLSRDQCPVSPETELLHRDPALGMGRVRPKPEVGTETAGCPVLSLRPLAGVRVSHVLPFGVRPLYSGLSATQTCSLRVHVDYALHVSSREEKLVSGSQLLSRDNQHTCCHVPRFWEESWVPEEAL